MKRSLFITVITVLVVTAGSAAWFVPALHHAAKPRTVSSAAAIDNAAKEKLTAVAASAKKYAAAHRFNIQFCFLVDMKMASGSQRFFVYDMKKNTISAKGLVTHGRCNKDWLDGRQYGNAVGCGCTSLGKYKIGNAYHGRFGLAYKLYGLDVTNSNAYNRFVVLHSHTCVPATPVDPAPICQSDGCPTVSPVFLKELAALINSSTQPVLLWIYN
ncbi:MAG: murein L,D-transpeptidase catalytic domain-containing protein [Chitinophagaceae bacterium]